MVLDHLLKPISQRGFAGSTKSVLYRAMPLHWTSPWDRTVFTTSCKHSTDLTAVEVSEHGRWVDMPVQQTNKTANVEHRIRHRRARAACQECRIRKIRCDVVEHGVPCSNCSGVPGVSCVLRRRKTSKSQSEESPPDEHDQRLRERCHSFQAIDPENMDDESSFRTPLPGQGQSAAFSTLGDQPAWTALRDISTQNAWTGDDSFPAQHLTADPGSASTGIDFSHLLDIDDIFAFTRENALPGCTGVDSDDPWSGTYVQQYLSPSSVRNSVTGNETNEKDRAPSIHVPGLSTSEEQYLQREGCLQLPPTGVLRQMIWSYFYMVHPALPVVAEDQVWSLWEGDTFRLGNFSFLLMRAMVFAATNVWSTRPLIFFLSRADEGIVCRTRHLDGDGISK